VFSICRSCSRPTIFILGLHADSFNYKETFNQEDVLIKYKDGLNEYFKVEGFINIRHTAAVKPPEYLRPELETVSRGCGLSRDWLPQRRRRNV
jgi:hypothetical protein